MSNEFRQYQIYASEGTGPKVVATVATLNEARKLMRQMAFKLGAKRINKDLWSTGTSAVFVRTYYPEASSE